MSIKAIMKRPVVMWTGLAIIVLVGAMLVPIEWVESVENLLGEPTEDTSVFSTDVGEVDRALREGEAVDVDADTLREMRPNLQVRRLLETGPMTSQEVRRAGELVEEFNRDIATQELEGSRQALRNERNRRLAEAFPRLDADQIGAELDRLDAQLDAAQR
jgi:hypothetical protein